jgi:hypothetical protein
MKLRLDYLSISLNTCKQYILSHFYVPKWKVWHLVQHPFLYFFQTKGVSGSSFHESEGYVHLVHLLAEMLFAGTSTSSDTLSFAVLFMVRWVSDSQIHVYQKPKSSWGKVIV